MKSDITFNGIGRIFLDLLNRYWFSACICAAILYLGIVIAWQDYVSSAFPMEPQPQIGAIYSWTDGLKHQKHYLTAEAHGRLVKETAGMFVYWFTICLASWVRIGMPSPSTWHNNYFEPDPKRTSQTICIVIFGGTISLLLLASAGLFNS